MLPFLIPVWVVASVVYAFKVWQGEDVDVPIVSDWVDARLPHSARRAEPQRSAGRRAAPS